MPVRGEVDTSAFEDIVQDVAPLAHKCCAICHPGSERNTPMTYDDNGNRLKAICGVLLLGNPDPPGERCQECLKMLGLHLLNHVAKGDI